MKKGLTESHAFGDYSVLIFCPRLKKVLPIQTTTRIMVAMILMFSMAISKADKKPIPRHIIIVGRAKSAKTNSILPAISDADTLISLRFMLVGCFFARMRSISNSSAGCCRNWHRHKFTNLFAGCCDAGNFNHLSNVLDLPMVHQSQVCT